MIIRINGIKFSLEGDGSIRGDDSPRKNGGEIKRVWRKNHIMISVIGKYIRIGENEEEGDDFDALLKINYRGLVKVIKVFGHNGC